MAVPVLTAGTAAPVGRQGVCRLGLFVLFLIWPVILVDTSGPSMADSTLLAAIRLVEARTWTLTDETDPSVVFRTTAFDISVHDGRIYSGVGPGSSAIAAVWYAVLRPVFALFDEDVVRNDRVLGYYLPNARALGVEAPAHFKEMYLLQIALVWTLMAPLFAWLLVRICSFMVWAGCRESRAVLAVAALGFGTMLLTYSSMYSRQGLGCLLAWHAILSLLRRGESGQRSKRRPGGHSQPRITTATVIEGTGSGGRPAEPGAHLDAGSRRAARAPVIPGHDGGEADAISRGATDPPAGGNDRAWRHWDLGALPGGTLVVAGLLLGAAVSIDYALAILVAITLLFLLPPLGWAARLRTLLPLGAMLFLVGLYHHAAFGSFFSTPYHHRFWLTHDVLAGRGVDLGAFQAGPLLGIGRPDPAVAIQLLIGPFKGLFVYSPVLLAGLTGLAAGLVGSLRLRRLGETDAPDEATPGGSGTGSRPLAGGAVARHVATLTIMSLVVFGAYLAFNAAIGSGLGAYAHHYWGGLSGLWGPRYLLATLPFLVWGLVRIDLDRGAIRAVILLALAVSCALNVLGALFARDLMAAFALGPELGFPPGHVLRLLFTEGPRITLLDAYGTPILVQATVLSALLLASAFLLRSMLREENPARRPIP